MSGRLTTEKALDQEVSPAQGMDTTQLEFTQAMKDFQTMFPDMDPDVIEAVLRSNNGTVDATIDQLLAMSTDVENEKLRSQLEAQEDQGMAASVSFPRTTQTFSTQTPGGSATSTDLSALRDRKNWNPPLLGPLPKSFLRLDTPDTQPGPANDQELAQFLEDERMAVFLQSEEFMHELRKNQDFMTSLDVPGQREGQDQIQDDAAFREKLKNMGKVSKKKFAQLARLFQRTSAMAGGRTAGKFKHMNPIPSRDNLLLGDEATSDSEDLEPSKPKNST